MKAMTVSSLNQSILLPSITASPKPNKQTKITTLAALSYKQNRTSFCPPLKSNTRRYPFNYLRAAARTTEDAGEGFLNDLSSTGKEAAKKQVLSLKTLIRAYKEAIVDGDEDTLLEIEAGIQLIESEKDKLVQQVSSFTAEIRSWKEKYIRLQADFDNFRKRSEKERLNTRSNAQGEVIESVLLMVDSFEQAKQQIIPETEKEKKIDASYQGIYKQFVEIMRSLNVSAVSTVGKPFDPLVHEAIAREESQEFKEGIVFKELRRGFRLGDRLLRPAMVKVSAGPGPRKTTVDTEKTAGQPATAAGVDERG